MHFFIEFVIRSPYMMTPAVEVTLPAAAVWIGHPIAEAFL